MCAPHVSAGEPGPPPAQERGGGCLRPSHGGRHPDTVHGQAAGRSGQCGGRVSSGDPPGETPAATAADSGALHFTTLTALSGVDGGNCIK